MVDSSVVRYEQPFAYDPATADFADRAYEIYRVLRDEHRVYRNEEHGPWVVSRYDDIRDVASDPETFSSEGTSISQGLLPMIQQMDPPRHHALRNLLWKAFTPKRVAAMEPRVRELAGELYWLLGSFSGTDPGLLLGDVVLPLNPDPYLNLTLVAPNQPPLGESFGTLDADGMGQASFELVAGANPGLAGLQLHHAYFVADPIVEIVVLASNAVGVLLVP